MPLVFPVVLLLILGAVTLASRSTNSYLAATKQSDGEAARQAAESGLARVMVALNPFGRGTTDPYVSFLLASTWTENVGWRITQRSAAAVRTQLRDCGLATRGLLTTNQIPASQSEYDDLLPPPTTTPAATPNRGLIGSAGAATQLRFKIVRYQPPPTAAPAGTWPSGSPDCSAFTTVTGGSGLITVEGSVWRNGRQMASHRLSRHLDFEGWPMVDLPDDTFPLPGPPVGLRIAQAGTNVGSLTSAIYKSIETDANPSTLTRSIGALRPQCQSGCPAGSFTNKFYPNNEDLPKPQDWENSLPAGLTLSTLKKEVIAENNIYSLPYDASGTLRPGICYNSANQTEINCYFDSISVSYAPVSPGLKSPYQAPVARIRVDTELKPVNVYIKGNVGSPSQLPSGDPSQNPAPARPAKDGKIVFEHCLKACSSAPVFFDHANLALRPRWSRLRIFGGNTTTTNQLFYIAAKSPQATSLHGVFLWLPQGGLNYGNPTYTWNAVNKTWSPASPEPAPADIMSTWWIQNLDLSNVSGALQFILPLYGNPEALSAILPSRVTSGSPPVPDPRFPVYSFLLRPRNFY